MTTAMPNSATSIASTLSAPRMSTYVSACNGSITDALLLYGWNAQISSALMVPAHFAEVATRNAADEALTAVYGARWPWNSTFEGSLPHSVGRYKPRQDLVTTRRRHVTTGKVIAEIKLVFWQSLFTSRHDGRLWNPHIINLFPNSSSNSPSMLRLRINADLEAIRGLRNRMAHHEPIFSRNLHQDLAKMIDLVELRSNDTAAWVRSLESAATTLANRP